MGRWLGLAGLLLAAALGYQYWSDNQVPAPSLEPGERASHVQLSAPEHVEIHHEQTQNSMLIARDNRAEDERSGGMTPEVFRRPTIPKDSLALARNTAPPVDDRPWWRRLDSKFMILIVAAVFIAVYGVLTASLKRGPGGRGMTNE